MTRDQNSETSLPQIESLLKKAVALDPAYVDAHFQLGVLCGDEAKYREPIQEFKRAIALQPDLTTAHYQLAHAYLRTGEKARAAGELRNFQRLRAQDQVETAKERNEVRQFVIEIKEHTASAPAR